MADLDEDIHTELHASAHPLFLSSFKAATDELPKGVEPVCALRAVADRGLLPAHSGAVRVSQSRPSNASPIEESLQWIDFLKTACELKSFAAEAAQKANLIVEEANVLLKEGDASQGLNSHTVLPCNTLHELDCSGVSAIEHCEGTLDVKDRSESHLEVAGCEAAPAHGFNGAKIVEIKDDGVIPPDLLPQELFRAPQEREHRVAGLEGPKAEGPPLEVKHGHGDRDTVIRVCIDRSNLREVSTQALRARVERTGKEDLISKARMTQAAYAHCRLHDQIPPFVASESSAQSALSAETRAEGTSVPQGCPMQTLLPRVGGEDAATCLRQGGEQADASVCVHADAEASTRASTSKSTTSSEAEAVVVPAAAAAAKAAASEDPHCAKADNEEMARQREKELARLSARVLARTMTLAARHWQGVAADSARQRFAVGVVLAALDCRRVGARSLVRWQCAAAHSRDVTWTVAQSKARIQATLTRSNLVGWCCHVRNQQRLTAAFQRICGRRLEAATRHALLTFSGFVRWRAAGRVTVYKMGARRTRALMDRATRLWRRAASRHVCPPNRPPCRRCMASVLFFH